MMNKFKTVAAVAALTALPFAASAAPFQESANLNVDTGYSFSGTADIGDSGGQFDFTVSDRLRINGFGLSVSGTAGGADAINATYEITKPAEGPSSFGVITTFGNSASGSTGVAGLFDYAVGDTFSVIFATAPVNTQPISYTVSFSTAAVPVPAAGLLLLTALGGAAALRRKKA